MMKKITLLLFALISIMLNAQTLDVHFNATQFSPDPTGTGLGYFNVFDNPKDGTIGSYQFGSAWGIPDLVAELDTGANTATLKPNRIGDIAEYWQTDGVLEGNKIADATLYIQDDDLVGNIINFHGKVFSSTLDGSSLSIDYTYIAFIKVFAPDFSSNVSQTYDLATVGDFTVTMDATSAAAGSHIQYGFQVIGPNINSRAAFDAQYDALGSIVIGAATASLEDLKQFNFAIYPNPANDVINLRAASKIEFIDVYDITGRRVLEKTLNAKSKSVNVSALSKGIYMVKVGIEGSVGTTKLLKQ